MTSTMVLIGLLVALVGLVGLARGRIVRLRVRNRTGAALVAAAGMVLALAAGASSPTAPDAQASGRGGVAASPTPSASASRPVPSGANSIRTTVPSASPQPRKTTPSTSLKPRKATPSATATTAGTPATSTPAAGTAAALLDTLPVKGRAPRTGYDRERFGQAWADTDRNGCDTRNDVLRRDLQAIVIRAGTHGCVVAQRHARRPLHRHGDRLRARRGHLLPGADRPRGGALRRLAEGRPAVVDADQDPVRQRPVEPPGRRRAHQPAQERRRRSDLAAAAHVLPLRLCRATDGGEGAVRRVGDRRREGRRTKGARHLPRPAGADGVRLRAARRRPHGHDGPDGPVASRPPRPPPGRCRCGRRRPPPASTPGSRRAGPPTPAATALTAPVWMSSTTGTATGTTTASSASGDSGRPVA